MSLTTVPTSGGGFIGIAYDERVGVSWSIS